MLDIGINFVNLRKKDFKNIGIFFDSLNERVCYVQSKGDESTISATSLNSSSQEILFNINEKGNRIRSINFSPDLQIASLQQENTIVEFIVLENNKITAKFQQASRFKEAVILGVHWLSNRQIAFVTDAGCEFYLVNSYKNTLKFIKNLAISVNWFSFYSPSNLFVCANGVSNDVLTCLTFQNNSPTIIGKFEVDFGCSPSKPRLLDRDIAIASIYGKNSILILKFEAANGFAMGLNVYEFTEESHIPTIRCFLKLNLIGLVGLHVIDNLILVHHKNEKMTLLFDIRLDNQYPICTTDIQISQSLLEHLTNVFPLLNSNSISSSDSFLYNSAWKMCLPDIVIDLQYELFTRVEIDVDRTEQLLVGYDTDFLLKFLINRRNGEKTLLNLLQRIILQKSLKFSRIAQIFRQILHSTAPENGLDQPVPKHKCPLPSTPFEPLSISHNNLLRCIFEPLNQHSEMDKTFLANLMVDFFLILKQKHIKVQETYISELLVKILVDANMFDRLQQLLQYGVIEKSKFLAYELISLSNQCSALYPIALDMLKRRHDWEQIVEILMNRDHLLEALRLLLNMPIDRGPFSKTLRKLLDKAWKSDERQLMFTVFSHLHYLQGRKQLAELISNDDLERYTQEFKLLYDQGEVEEAVARFRMARLSSLRRRRSSAHRIDSLTSAGGDDDDGESENGQRERNKREKERGKGEHELDGEEGSSSNRTEGSTSDQQSAGTTSS